VQNLVLSREELDAQRHRVARYCAEVIEHHAAAVRPLTAQDAHNAAVALTLRMIEMQDINSDGAYIDAQEAAAMIPLILLRRGLSARRRARVLVHEMATHLQRTSVAPALFGVDTVECPVCDGRKVRHQIARDVEGLVLSQ